MSPYAARCPKCGSEAKYFDNYGYTAVFTCCNPYGTHVRLNSRHGEANYETARRGLERAWRNGNATTEEHRDGPERKEPGA